ncbi:MAG TPA: 30S ribosomal protein S20 [Bacteroidales bacterium]|jgi:small subunit ribosomal protein S20|nr:30S ribosomal protein S20 [Bacteroidales bacterium]
MANHKSSEKRIRQDEARKTKNKYAARGTRNALKEMRSVTDKAAASEMLPKVTAMLDKLAKKRIIHPNKAANLKSEITKQVNNIK